MTHNIVKFPKIYKNFNIIDFAVPIIDVVMPVKYSPARKYDTRYIFTCLLDYFKKGGPWTSYVGLPNDSYDPIKGKYLGDYHRLYVDNGVYDELNRQILNLYLSKGREQKLKYQSIDSSFVANKGGSIEKNNYLLSEKVKNKNNLIEKCNMDTQQISTEGDEGIIHDMEIMDVIMAETESIDDTDNTDKKSTKRATFQTPQKRGCQKIQGRYRQY